MGPGGEWRKPKIHISLKSDEGLLVRKITDQSVQGRAADLGLKEERWKKYSPCRQGNWSPHGNEIFPGIYQMWSCLTGADVSNVFFFFVLDYRCFSFSGLVLCFVLLV